MNKPAKSKNVDALNNVVMALEPLPMEERKRVISAASAFLLDSVLPSGGKTLDPIVTPRVGSHSAAKIISENSNLRPGHKAAIVAYDFAKQNEFTLDELRKHYEDIGITPPDRFDMTLKSAVVKGNKLFKSPGRNCYALTFHGQELAKKFCCGKGV